MQHLNPQKTALTVGLFLGGWHLIWSLIVGLGIGQAIYDFVLWAHMIHLSIVIGPFDATAAVVLVAVTAVIGYVLGFAFAYLWNWMHRSS